MQQLTHINGAPVERGAADAERYIRSFAVKFHTEEGDWDLVGNNTSVFSPRPDARPDLNHSTNLL